MNGEYDERGEPEEADQQTFRHVELEQRALHGILPYAVKHHLESQHTCSCNQNNNPRLFYQPKKE